MTPREVKKYYKTGYKFWQETGMSQSTLRNWLRQKYVPENAQYRLECITKGALKTDWTVSETKEEVSKDD